MSRAPKHTNELPLLQQYAIDGATHKLRCRHQIGRNGFDYFMPCIPLSKTKSGKIKILVFGERYWKYKEYLKSIRYVWAYRIIPRPTIPYVPERKEKRG